MSENRIQVPVTKVQGILKGTWLNFNISTAYQYSVSSAISVYHNLQNFELFSHLWRYHQTFALLFSTNFPIWPPCFSLGDRLSWDCLWQISASLIVEQMWIFEVVVRACYEAYFVAHIFKYLAPNFASGRPAWCCFLEFLYNERGTFNCPRGLQLPARLSNCQCTFI